MGTNCAPLLADFFLYSYESEFLQKLVKDKKIHEARAFNFTYRYIDDVLSINNSRFAEFPLFNGIKHVIIAKKNGTVCLEYIRSANKATKHLRSLTKKFYLCTRNHIQYFANR